jgi:uncharacterized membrane protein
VRFIDGGSTDRNPARPKESDMNRQFKTTSNLARAVAAISAIVLTTLVVTVNLGLADHYNVQAELAAAKVPVIAYRQ